MSKGNVIRVRYLLEANPKLKLPQGELSLAVLAPEGRVPSVQAAYVAIPGRGKRVVETRSFDDGAVAVDLDTKGRVRGIEFLALRQTVEFPFPQFLRFARRSGEEVFLLAAAWTAASLWDQFETSIAVHVGAAPDDFKAAPRRVQSVLKKRPSARRWQQAPAALSA